MTRLQNINAFLDPNCGSEINCDSKLCQGYLTCFHEITKADHDLMIRRFFNGNLPAPASFTIGGGNEDINIHDADCAQLDYIFFHGDENDRVTNQRDVNDVWVEKKSGGGFIGKYSLTLFKGIFDFFSPEYIHFSKAINDQWGYTLVFYVTQVGSNTPVYYGDLSDVYP